MKQTASPSFEGLPRLWFGGDYNPEQWPESVWPEDIRLMKKAGVNVVSLGIFSWALLQPEEQRFDFGWLDRIVALLHEGGIRINMATATASPPPWLVSAYPDVLPVTAAGVPLEIGSRQSYSPCSPSYRSFSTALTRRIAQRYGHHPAVISWHINNEYACHVKDCHGPHTRRAFREWLCARYGTLDRLNQAWGTAFWSQHYTDWEQIPTPGATPAFANPAHLLDYRRFFNDAVLDLYLQEKEILEAESPGRPVNTNFMGAFKPLDYWKWAPHQSYCSWDTYPDPKPSVKDHAGAALGHDLLRSLKPDVPFVVMEQVTSHVNWRDVNANKHPGVMRLWSLQGVARGADGILFFQWRQSLRGAEKFHGAIVQHAGAEGTRVFEEVCGLGDDLKKLAEVRGSRVNAKIAIVFDWENWWALESPTKPAILDYIASVAAFHKAAYQANLAVDFVPPHADLSRYSFVAAPSLYLLRESDAETLSRFVENGGTLAVTYFSGIVDEEEAVLPGGYPHFLRKTLGLRVEEWFPLSPDESIPLRDSNEQHLGTGSVWSEKIHLEGATPLAFFDGDPLKGSPAVTAHAFGRGQALYLGTAMEPEHFAAFLMAWTKTAGIQPDLACDPGVEVSIRTKDGREFLFLLNHNRHPAYADPGDRTGKDLLTGRPLSGRICIPPLDAVVMLSETR